MERTIALIDMDCFYVQVEQRDVPETWGKPCVVNQYTGGGLIAVNYEARNCGVTRGMRAAEAKQKCPDCHFFQVPEERGKANLTKYRNASAEVFAVICSFSDKIVVERASIDEAFLDLTKFVEETEFDLNDVSAISDVRVEGIVIESEEENPTPTIEVYAERVRKEIDQDPDDDSAKSGRNLIVASKAVTDIRQAIKAATQFSCSAGVSHNKTLAKLGCGVRKPSGQTIVPKCGIETLYERTLIKKVRNLGGKLGHRLRDAFMIETMGQLAKDCTIEALTRETDYKTAEWLFALSRGIDDEPVSDRQLLKSVGCGKNFPKGLQTLEEVKHWALQLTEEMIERLKKDESENRRRAKNMIVGVRFRSDQQSSLSRTLPIEEYDVSRLLGDIMKFVLTKLQLPGDLGKIEPIINLSLSASKFIDSEIFENSAVSKTRKVSSYFSAAQNPNASGSAEVIKCNYPATATCGNDAITGKRSHSPEITIINDDGVANQSANTRFPDISANQSKSSESRGFFYRKTQELMAKRAKKV